MPQSDLLLGPPLHPKEIRLTCWADVRFQNIVFDILQILRNFAHCSDITAQHHNFRPNSSDQLHKQSGGVS